MVVPASTNDGAARAHGTGEGPLGFLTASRVSDTTLMSLSSNLGTLAAGKEAGLSVVTDGTRGATKLSASFIPNSRVSLEGDGPLLVGTLAAAFWLASTRLCGRAGPRPRAVGGGAFCGAVGWP